MSSLAAATTPPVLPRLVGSRLLLPVASLVLLSLAVKAGMLMDSYYHGFLPRNFATLFSDEITYIEEGRQFFDGASYDYGIGSNWLYVFLNYVALSVTGSEAATYLTLGAMNVVLSTVTPFLLLPLFRDAFPGDSDYRRASLWFLAAALLWPQGLILASHNLKDVMTQFVTVGYLAGFYAFFLRNDGRNVQSAELVRAAVLLGIALLLLFSLRNYLAVILAFASFVLLVTRRPTVALAGLAIVAAFYWSVRDQVSWFLENNWLIDAGARQDMLASAFDWGDTQARINATPGDIAVGALRFFLAPFPSAANSGYGWLLVIQSSMIYFLAYFFFRGRKPIDRGFTRFVLLLFALLALFYGVAELISGPRQRFASFDFLFLAVAAAGWATAGRGELIMALGVFAGVYLMARSVF